MPVLNARLARSSHFQEKRRALLDVQLGKLISSEQVLSPWKKRVNHAHWARTAKVVLPFPVPQEHTATRRE